MYNGIMLHRSRSFNVLMKIYALKMYIIHADKIHNLTRWSQFIKPAYLSKLIRFWAPAETTWQ